MTQSNQHYAWIDADHCYQSVSDEYAEYWQFDDKAQSQSVAAVHGASHSEKLLALLEKAQQQGTAQAAIRGLRQHGRWLISVFWHPQQRLYLVQMHAEQAMAADPAAADPSCTGVLVERETFLSRLRSQLERSKKAENSVALICIDLDRFQWIHDTLGGTASDALLNEIAERLRSVVRAQDVVARFSGDTFMLMITGLECAEDAETVAQRVVERLGHGIFVDRRELFVSASAGVAIYPQHGREEAALLRHADVAMYAAKRAGRNTYCLFSATLSGESQTDVLNAGELAAALENEQLDIYYCPIFDNTKHRLCGAQLIPGWLHPQLGWLSLEELIPAAVKDNLLDPLTEWVWTKVAQMQPQLDSIHGCSMQMLHLEEAQLMLPNFIPELSQAIRQRGLCASGLIVEVDMQQAQTHDSVIFDLQEMGFRVALRGANALHWEQPVVRDLQPDWFKLTAQQVQGLSDPSNNTAALLGLAAPSIPLMAEGVTSAGLLSQLINQGCALMQGRYFSELLTLDQLTQWMELEHN